MQSNIEKYAYLTLVVIVGLLILRLKTALPGSVDHFFPLSISHDLLVTGGKFSDWVLMGAPRYFPDLLIVFIAKLLYGDIIRVFLYSGIALLILQMATIYFLSYMVSGTRRIGIAVAAGYIAFSSFYGGNLFVADIPWHSGSFAIIILVLGLVLAGIRFPSKLRSVSFGIICLGSLVVASDFIAIPFLLAGTSTSFFVVTMYHKRLPKSEEWLLVSSVIISVVFGVILYYLVTPNYFINPLWDGNFSLRKLLVPSAVFDALVGTFFSIFTRENMFLVGAAIGILTLIIYRSDKKVFMGILFFLTFVLTNALANEFLIEFGAWNMDSYRIFSLNGLSLLFALCLGLIANKYHWGVTGFMSVIAVILLINTQANTEPVNKEVVQNYSNASCIAEAIQEESLQVGVTGLGTGQLLLAISGHRLNLIQIQGVRKTKLNALVPIVESNEIDYLVSIDTNIDMKPYSGAWMTIFTTKAAEEMFGNADRQIECGNYRLHIFENPIDFHNTMSN